MPSGFDSHRVGIHLLEKAENRPATARTTPGTQHIAGNFGNPRKTPHPQPFSPPGRSVTAGCGAAGERGPPNAGSPGAWEGAWDGFVSPFQGFRSCDPGTRGGAALCPGLICRCPFGAKIKTTGDTAFHDTTAVLVPNRSGCVPRRPGRQGSGPCSLSVIARLAQGQPVAQGKKNPKASISSAKGHSR